MAPVSNITPGLVRPRTSVAHGATTRSTEAEPTPIKDSTPDPRTASTTIESAPKIDEESMQGLVEQMQKAIAGTPAAPYSVAFRPRDGGDGYVIEIRDEEGEIVKQFPPEKMLNLSGKIAELTGMVVDKKT